MEVRERRKDATNALRSTTLIFLPLFILLVTMLPSNIDSIVVVELRKITFRWPSLTNDLIFVNAFPNCWSYYLFISVFAIIDENVFLIDWSM